MPQNLTKSQSERQRLAKRLAFEMTDAESLEECVGEVRKAANLSDAEARIVGAAFRAKMLPNVMRQEGLSDRDVKELMRTAGFGVPLTVEFADKKPAKSAPEKHKGDISRDVARDVNRDLDRDVDDDEFDDDIAMEEDADQELHDDEDFLHDERAPKFHDFAEEDGDEEDDAFDGVMDSADDSATHSPKKPRNIEFSDEMGSHEDDMGDDFSEKSEGDSDGMATIQLRVPASAIEDIQNFLDEKFGDGAEENDFGGESDSDDSSAPDPMGQSSDAKSAPKPKPFPPAAPSGSDDPADDESSADESDEKPAGERPQAMARKVQTLTKEAQRKANTRDAVITRLSGSRLAETEENKARDIGLGKDTSEGTYMGESPKPLQYAADAQYKAEDAYDTFGFKNSDGNSLRDQNPTYAKQEIPTLNPENLGLKSGLSAVKKEGTVAGDIEYLVDFDLDTHVPSGDPDMGSQNFAVPTQMGTMPRKTTVASVESKEEAEEALYQLLVTAGVREDSIPDMTFDEAFTLHRQISAHQISTLARYASDSDTTINIANDKVNDKEIVHDDRLKKSPDDLIPSLKSEEASTKEAALYKARLKTAYAVSAKLALSEIIDVSEIDSNASMWMNDGLSVNSMLETGKQFLRMVQTNAERVAGNQMEKMTREASTRGAMSIPAFASQRTAGNSSAVSDLHNALRSPGFFSSPEIDE